MRAGCTTTQHSGLVLLTVVALSSLPPILRHHSRPAGTTVRAKSNRVSTTSRSKSAPNLTRVSNELGAGNAEGVRLAVRVVMFIAVTQAVLITGALLASQRILGNAYSSDMEVVEYVNAMVPFICISVAADCLQGVFSGIARGCGWQHLGAYVKIGSFYLFGIPMCLLLGFVLKLGGK